MCPNVIQPSATRCSIIGEKATTPVLLHIERSKLSREPPGEGVSTGHVLPGGVAGVDPGEKISQLVNAFTFTQISCWRWREGSVYYQIVLYIISPK